MIDPQKDPITQAMTWLAEATKTEPEDPNAAALATVGADGKPSVRMVLVKELGPDGAVFFTNYTSRKGGEIDHNPTVALCMHWKSLRRQVRLEGVAEKLTAAESDAYFDTRAVESKIGAWASKQSQPLESDAALYEAANQLKGKKLSRPPHWGGYRVVLHTVELWAQRPGRLHERVVYTLENGGWRPQRLYP